MNFRSIEELSGERRLLHHEETEHKASCFQCGKAFVSHSHAAIHMFQCHNILCVKCGKICEGRCLVEIVRNSENAGSSVMNKMLEDVENQIKEEERKYLDKFANISEQQMQLYMNMLWSLDIGFSGCMTNSWGMINYTPFVELNPSLWELSEFGQEYVLRHTYLSAMKKLNQYLYKANKRGISALIEAYSKDCLRLHSENAILSMRPEKLIGVEICFPEREIGDQPTVLWVESTSQEISTEKDEFQVKSKPQALNHHFILPSGRASSG